MKQGWEIKKLGEVCAKLTDGSHNPPKGVIHSNFIMLSSQNVFNDCLLYDDVRFLQEEDFIREDKRTYVREGDVLLTIVGTIGRCAVFTGNKRVALQRSVAVLHPHINILPRFLMYCLIGRNTSLNEQAHGIAQKGIYLKQLSQINIPVPPLPEQEKIVSELDCLSGIIEKKRQQLKELDALAQSIFYEMFGDPVTNEKGWEVKRLGEVATSDLGKMLDSSKNQGDFYPYLCSINVQWNNVDCSQIKKMRIEQDELGRYRLQKGDLLICEGGDTGRCAIWNSETEMYYQNALHRVRFNENLILPIYCLFVMKLYKENGEIDKYSTGQTIKHLVKKVLLTIPFPLPPLSLQQTFASKIEAIEKQKALIKQSLGEVETLFNARMQEYFG